MFINSVLAPHLVFGTDPPKRWVSRSYIAVNASFCPSPAGFLQAITFFRCDGQGCASTRPLSLFSLLHRIIRGLVQLCPWFIGWLQRKFMPAEHRFGLIWGKI